METKAFKRSQRLLTPKDFKATFDNAKLRFSSPVLLVLAAEKVPTEPSRLGLVVAKKHLKRAVDRNQFKRIVRESFRHQQQQLVGLDIVVLARSGAINADKQELHHILAKAWGYIDRKRRQNRPNNDR